MTQLLGGLFPVAPWYIAVAQPSGSVTAYPKPEDLTVFCVPHGSFIKMHMGTWHAGQRVHRGGGWREMAASQGPWYV